MDNIGKIINVHNKSITRKLEKPTKTCNCRKPQDCPLDGKCLTDCVIYKATVSTDHGHKTYVGLCETAFKSRWNIHKSSFRLQHKRN